MKDTLGTPDLLIPRRTREDREKNHIIATSKMIQEYIKNGVIDDLWLLQAPITKLPDNLVRVNGDLNLRRSKIRDLNNLQEVIGSLNLEGTPIETLPNNLIIRGNLYLMYSLITVLPDNLEIIPKGKCVINWAPRENGKIYLSKTPLSKNKELIEKYKLKYDISYL